MRLLLALCLLVWPCAAAVPSSAGIIADPSDKKVAATNFPLLEICSRSLANPSDPAKAAQACKAAADEAEKFPPGHHFKERRIAFVYAATAFTRIGQNKQAISYEDRAVALAQQGYGDFATAAADYGSRAQSRALIGDFVGAERDVVIAEDAQRKALDTPIGRDAHTAYVEILRKLMKLHAQLLRDLGRNAEAKAKLDEAAKL